MGTDATGPLNADTYDLEFLGCLLDFRSAKDMSATRSNMPKPPLPAKHCLFLFMNMYDRASRT